MSLKDFLKDYGTLVGSSLGFVFAVLALYVKYLFDNKTNYWTTQKKLKKLAALIGKHKVPKRLTTLKNFTGFKEPEITEDPHQTVDDVNAKSIQIFNNKLKFSRTYISKIEDDVLKYASTEMIEAFFRINEHLEILTLNVSEYLNLKKEYDELVEGVLIEGRNTDETLKNQHVKITSQYLVLTFSVDRLHALLHRDSFIRRLRRFIFLKLFLCSSED
jgi:hypothetical protein